MPTKYKGDKGGGKRGINNIDITHIIFLNSPPVSVPILITLGLTSTISKLLLSITLTIWVCLISQEC